MSVTIKTKTEQTEVQFTSESAMAETVDKFVEVKAEYDMQLRALDPMKKEFEAEKKKLTAYMDSHFDPTEEMTLEGNEHAVLVSPKYREAEMASNAEILKAIGIDNFLMCVKPSVTELKKYLSPAELEEILQYRNTGARRVKSLK